jgi:hypothetical protein
MTWKEKEAAFIPGDFGLQKLWRLKWIHKKKHVHINTMICIRPSTFLRAMSPLFFCKYFYRFASVFLTMIICNELNDHGTHVTVSINARNNASHTTTNLFSIYSSSCTVSNSTVWLTKSSSHQRFMSTNKKQTLQTSEKRKKRQREERRVLRQLLEIDNLV